MATSRIKTSSILQGFPKSRSLLAGNAGYDPAATWLIQRVNPTSGATTVSFTSIPQTYKHLQIRALTEDSTSASNTAYPAFLQFNSDSNSNYNYHYLLSNGTAASAVGSATTTDPWIYGADSISTTANIFGAVIIDIHDYASTTKNKTTRYISGLDRNGSGFVALGSTLWRNTAAITRIDLVANFNGFAAGSTFALYGMVG
jgi:hypothetical protein